MNKPIDICVVGAGRVGKLHSMNILRHVSGARLAAIVETDEAVLEKAGAELGVDTRFSTLEAACEHVAFDAVVITTPTFTHRDLTLMAAEQGKHIFLEKPMALKLQECEEMACAVERKGVLLQLGFMRRFDPAFESAAERIAAGEIGRPMMIKSLTHGPGLPPPWARDLTTSNGLLAEVNSHDWDCVRWFMGSNPERVYVEVSNLKGKGRGIREPNFYDNALTLIRFENNGLGVVSGICPCDYGYDARVEVVGEKGLLQVGELKSEAVTVCVAGDHGLSTRVSRSWAERFAESYVREIQHFVDSIRGGMRPRVGAEEGRWAVAGVLAATRSFLENRPVCMREILAEASIPQP